MTLAENLGTSTTGTHSRLPKLQTNEDYIRLYSRQGFKVFPATPGMKKPEVNGWQKKADSDLDMLLESYDLFGGKFKDSEIATRTGISFIVADDDGEGLDMPPTPHYNSQKEGRFQYLVKVPEGMEIRNIPKKSLGIEVDIKGLGGLAILPSGFNNREWVLRPDEVPIADCPEWLLEKIRAYQDSKNTPTTKLDGAKTYSYSTEPIPEGERNDTLFERALYLAYRSFSYDEIIGDLRFLNENACETPLEDEDLKIIAGSAVSYVDEEKSQKIRTMVNSVKSQVWKRERGKNIRSVLIALLKEDLDRYTLLGDEIEVEISYSRIAEKAGLSLTTVKKIIKEMAPVYLRRGREPKGKRCGTLILNNALRGYPINISSSKEADTREKEMPVGEPFNAPLFYLELNSMRRGNLGKPACMVLELLMERPHTRREIVDRLGYSKGGADYTLNKLKNKKKLIDSEDGLYSLAENFFELLSEEIEINERDIRVLREKLQDRRLKYHLRLDSWDEAVKQFHEEILPTAKEAGGAYLYGVVHNRTSIIGGIANRLGDMRYIELKAAQNAEKGVCYDGEEPEEATEGDEPGPAATASPFRPEALRDQDPTKAHKRDSAVL